MLPDGRTHDYAVWRACERFKIRPPKVKADWDEIDMKTQMELLGYDQIRGIEDVKRGL